MKQIWLYATILIVILSACTNAIKNEEGKVLTK